MESPGNPGRFSNPGTTDMEIITKQEGVIERLQQTDELDEGRGYAIGTVFRLAGSDADLEPLVDETPAAAENDTAS